MNLEMLNIASSKGRLPLNVVSISINGAGYLNESLSRALGVAENRFINFCNDENGTLYAIISNTVNSLSQEFKPTKRMGGFKVSLQGLMVLKNIDYSKKLIRLKFDKLENEKYPNFFKCEIIELRDRGVEKK